MNTRRIIFWICFFLVLALIVWGLAVAMKKSAANPNGLGLGSPPPVSDSDHIRGPQNAPVTLIEYGDFQCPACESYYTLIERLEADASTTMRLVFRHFPLYPTPHKNAMISAEAAESAGAQGKFWDMYDVLFSKHTDWTELADPTSVFVGYAGDIGLNKSQFTADLASSTLKDHIQADKDAGINIGINSTPTFFVNGKAIANPSSYDEFKALIDAAAASSAH